MLTVIEPFIYFNLNSANALFPFHFYNPQTTYDNHIEAHILILSLHFQMFIMYPPPQTLSGLYITSDGDSLGEKTLIIVRICSSNVIGIPVPTL